MNHYEAMSWLLDRGYFVKNDAGWCRADKRPLPGDIAQYVHAIKTLGAWSVGSIDGSGKVEVSTGSAPYEILFRVKGI